MPQSKRLIQIGLMAGTVFSKLGAQVLFFVVLARNLPNEEFGSFVFYFSVAAMLTIPFDYGHTNSTLHQIGKNSLIAWQIFKEKLQTKALVFIPIATTLSIFHALYKNSNASLLLLILWLAATLQSVTELSGCVMRATGKYAAETIILIITTTTLIITVITNKYPWSTIDYALMLLIYRAVQLLPIFIISMSLTRQQDNAEKTQPIDIKRVLRRDFPFAADYAATATTSNLDTLILSQFAGPLAAAIYQAGQKIVTGYSSIALIFSNVFLPILSKKLNDKTVNATSTIAVSSLLFILTGTAGAIALNLYGEEVNYTIYKNSFPQLQPILHLFGILILLKFVAAASGIVLTAIGAQKSRLLSNAISILMLITLSPWFLMEKQATGMVQLQILICASTILMYGTSIAINKFRKIHD